MGGFIGLCHRRMLISARGRKSETSTPLPAGASAHCPVFFLSTQAGREFSEKHFAP
jgi:hypothetical protein